MYFCFMTYQETIEFLFNRLPLFSRVGASAIKPGLDNIRQLCQILGNPHHQFKSIHVAGTNGKGSTSHMIAAILQSAGYKTGLYTSPHLKDFRERIKVNGKMIHEDEVTGFTEKILPFIPSIDPSFFEITVAMAFDHFSKQTIDVAVIEVGLGGRLDSTNIIEPVLSVITNIGWDHMNLLGDTLPKIAGEKAGIIKPGIPVVIGETREETKPVFDHSAAENHAPIFYADQLRYAAEWKQQNGSLDVWIQEGQSTERKHYQLDLPGVYQLKNLVTVLEAVHQLRLSGFDIEESHLLEGLSHSRKINGLHGRWQLLQKDPRVIVDVAHNEDGIKQLLAQLEMTDYQQLHLVIGMVKDKEVDKVLGLLPREAVYYFTKAQIPRALDEQQLMEKASAFSLKGNCYPTVREALNNALNHANNNDLVLVCGSVFVVAELL